MHRLDAQAKRAKEHENEEFGEQSNRGSVAEPVDFVFDVPILVISLKKIS